MEESALKKDAFLMKEAQETDGSSEQTLVNIGRAFTLWRDMSAKAGARSDAHFAMMLLYSYKNAKEKPLHPAVNNRFCPTSSVQSTDGVQVQNMNELYPQHRSISNVEQSIEVTLELDQMEESVSEPEATTQSSDEDDVSEEEEGRDKGDAKSDEDWFPLPEEEEEEEEFNQDEAQGPYMKQLCTDCGAFHFNKTNHTCEHKIKLYVCNICGKRCVTEHSLKVHSNIHSETYEHYCKYCCATFKTKLDKRAHEEIHQNQPKPYLCPDCMMTFASKKEQKMHLKNHIGQKKYICDICGIVYLKRNSLNRHLMIHTGMKPHKCSTCKRTFTQLSHLKSHMRVHTGEQPYKCQHCDKSFNHNVSLKSHIQRYHPPESEDKDAKSNDNENVQKQDTETIRLKVKQNLYSTGRPLGRPKKPNSHKQ